MAYNKIASISVDKQKALEKMQELTYLTVDAQKDASDVLVSGMDNPMTTFNRKKRQALKLWEEAQNMLYSVLSEKDAKKTKSLDSSNTA